MRQILIGGAWPYANGSLHIGHIAGLLPGDVLARYHRAIGDKVYFVSGSDCHGTPVAIRAKQENKTPQEISDFYHSECTGQGDSGHAQADMVTEVYGHILDEDRKKNAQMMETAFYNKENLNPDMHIQTQGQSKSINVPDGVDTELLMKVLGNPEMAALLTSLAKTKKA